MPENGIFSGTISLLQKSLNLRSMQHRVLASNIANIDTPHYKAFELAVEEELNKGREASRAIRLVRTHAGHFPVGRTAMDRVKLKTADPPEFSLRGDGNTVDMDRTMGKMAENTIMYKTAAQLISMKLKGLKNVIRGGK